MSANVPKVEGEISTPDVSLAAPEELDLGAAGGVEADTKSSLKLKWPFKRSLKSKDDEGGSGAESESDLANTEADVPAFVFHRLPKADRDSFGGLMDGMGLSRETVKEDKDYVFSKGIRMPFVNNSTANTGVKVDILERLKLSREKSLSVSSSPTDSKTDLNLSLGGASASASADADTSLARGGTFKIEKPDSVLGLITPDVTTNENDKLSLGLSNMLGLNVKSSK